MVSHWTKFLFGGIDLQYLIQYVCVLCALSVSALALALLVILILGPTTPTLLYTHRSAQHRIFGDPCASKVRPNSNVHDYMYLYLQVVLAVLASAALRAPRQGQERVTRSRSPLRTIRFFLDRQKA